MHTFLRSNRLGRWLAVLLLALLSTASAWAQSTANYAFATNPTGSLVDMSSGTTSVLTAAVYHDDDASAVQAIGFTFGFMGTAYTQFSVNSNGQLQFGGTAISGGQATPFTNLALLAPMGGDNAIQAMGKVHYKVLPGTNRVLVVEWNSLRIPYSSTVGTGSVVQALMEENTGKIEYRYGAVYNNSTSQSRAIFLSSGSSAGQIGLVKTFTTTPTYDATVTAATTTALPDNAAVPVLNSTADGARTVFTFTPTYTATPAVPSVSGTATGPVTLSLTITDNSTTETFFAVYRSTDNTNFTLVGSVNSTTPAGTGTTYSFAQTGLAPGTTYYYRVAASNEVANASGFATTSVTTQPAVAICGTKSVGPSAADYPTLTAAFSAIAVNGVCGPLVLELQSAYVSTSETFPLAYTTPAGASAINTVTVRPAAGATGLSISSAATQTLNLNGGRYLILDGRPGGSGATPSGTAQATDLVVANTSTTGIAIQFTNDASFNTVQHCQVKGVGTSLSSYPDILFSSTASGSGNSDNLIRFNNVGDGATLPYSLMYSANALNARNTVSDNNLFNYYGASASTAAALYLSSAGPGWVVTNNSIYQTTARTPTGATHYGLFMGSGFSHTVTSNFIGGSAPLAGGPPHTVTGTVAAYRFVGIYLSTSGPASSVQNNTVANISWVSSSGATTTFGVLSGIYVNAGDANIGTVTGNTIGTATGPITVNISTAAGYSFGISTASTGLVTIAKNVISNITTSGSTAAIASNVAGINLGGGALNTVVQNKIYGLTAASGGASLSNGILITAGTTNNVSNNLIGGLTAPTSTSLAAVSGIQLTAGSNNNIAFNTIRLDGTSTGATFGTQGFYLNTTTVSVSLFDNLIVNLSVPVGAGGVATAIRRISGTAGTAPGNLTGNNNLYYAGTPSATNLIYTEGTTTQTNAQQTLAAYKAFLVTREANSVTEAATPFASTNGADPNYLHLTPGAATQAESAGQPFNGISTDYDGDARNANTPDIGADEGSFLLTDQTGPVITNLAFTSSASSTSTRTLTATITDPSGVATGANAPRLYFRKGNAGAYVVAAAPTVSGSTYTFTFDYSLIGGVATGDQVTYYLAAQDALGNVSTNPTTGGGGATPPGTTPPTIAYSFTISGSLSGTYYVSATAATSPVPARTYATLTAAVAAYNTSGLAGAVTFLLLDPTYSTAETFPIAILNNADASATNTLTIKPSNATGTTSFAITGSTATAILQLLASDYVTIDGSLGNTLSATDPRPSRDLTISNTNTGTSSLVVQQFAQFTNDGATFNTIKNLVAVGTTTATTAATLYGIQLQSPGNASTPNQYLNNTVQNCAVRGTQIGIASIGGGIALKTQNTVITQNDLNATGTGAITRNGIFVLFDNNGQVTLNNIGNFPTSSNKLSGILMGFSSAGFSNTTFSGSEVTNALVSRNNISNLSNTSTYSAVGIAVASALSGTNTVVDNFVAGVLSNGTAGDFGAGIYVNGFQGGGTTRVLYNSVSMTGTATGASQPSFALAVGGNLPTLEIRNNVLYNSQSTGSSSYAIGFAYAGTTGNYAGLTSTNNAFAGTSGIGLTGGLVTGTARATLADLNTETGQDRPTTATSPAGTSLTLSGSPFLSNTDLHVAGTTVAGAALNGAATPIAGITQDFDGETRNATTPDIGADEFSTNLDVAAGSLVSPVAANQCFTNAETVTVSITNANATTTLNFANTPVTVTVTITGPGAPQTLTQVVNTGTLAAGASQNVTFTGTADLSTVGTYSVTVRTTLVGDENASNNNLAPITITTAPARSAAFTLPATTLCAGAGTTLTPTLGTGATAGTFTATPAGLNINATTGVVSATGSAAGAYTVTNTLPAGNGCAVVTATQPVNVAPQTTATFSYAGTTYCQTGTNPTPAITGTAGGAFSATPSGLTLDPATGVITLSSSTPGAYTVTYAVGGTCPSSSTQSVTITAPQSAAFSYPAGSNCAGSTGSVTATLGSGAAAGTFTATPAGLSLDPATGAVNLSASSAGTYTVTNTLAAANGCAQVTSTASITLNATPSTAFAYSGGTFCQTGTNPTPTVTGQTGGTFSATPAGLSIDPATGAINLAASSIGTYAVTYAVAGTCAASSSTTVTISTAPSAAFTFAAGSNCAGSAGTLTPSFGPGSSAGMFTATPAGLSIDPSTGVVTLSTSTAGTYTVTNSIAASGGCAAATASQTLTLNTAPVATLAAGGPTTFCQGGSVTLTAPAGTGNTYQFFNGTTSLGAASATNTFTATAAGSYTVVMTNAATCQATSAATVVTVNPQTTATFSYTGSPFCRSNATNPAPTVTGTAGGTFTSTTGLTINATTGVLDLASSTPGSYVVTYAVGGPCPSSSTQSVTITAPAVATFSYGTSSTFCQSGIANPAVVLGAGATAGTFSVSPATGLTLDATTGAITLSSSTPGTYTVTNTVAAAGGCAAATATASVTITAAPTATFSYGTTSTYCVSGATNPAVVLAAGATAGTFSSTTGLTLNANTGAITLSSSTPGTYTVTNTVAAANGCAAATATTSVTITAAPLATFSYGTTSTYCVSGTTNPAVVLGTGATAGTFSSAPGLTLNATTGAITLSSSTPGTYTVTNTVAAANGCAAATATTQVTITVAPVATFSYTVNRACAGSATLLMPTLGTGATAGTFSSTSGLTINATTGAVNPATSTAGTYTVTNTVAASGGCAAATSTATVTINALPATPTYTYTYPTPSTVLFTSSVAPAGTTYQWYLNGVAIVGATSQTYTANGATAPGTYTVRFISTATGCQSAASTPLTVTATQQTLAGSSLQLFPNPTTTGLLTLQLSGYSKAVQLTVLDALGRVVLTQKVAAGQVQTQLDLSGSATGVYLLRATTDGGTEIRRIVRE